MQKGYIMEQNEINKKLNDHTMDTLDLIKQLFNMIKQQREYNLLQDQLIEGLQNRVKKLEGRSKWKNFVMSLDLAAQGASTS